MGDIQTPVAATVFIPDTNQTVTFLNRETPYINPSLMPHDLFVARPDLPAWKVCAWSSKIPFVLESEARVLPPPSELELGLEESGYPACNVATVYGYAPVDGAVSAAYGVVGAASKKNMIIITVYKTKTAKPLDYSGGSRRSGWWLLGAFIALIESTKYMLQNEGEDKLWITKQLGARELSCSATTARAEMKEKFERDFPDHKDFNQYNLKTSKEIFDTDSLKKYATEGMVLCVSSGGAYAIDELSAICALCDVVMEQPDCNQGGIINLITGTSAGALNALYISQIHDKIFGMEEL